MRKVNFIAPENQKKTIDDYLMGKIDDTQLKDLKREAITAKLFKSFIEERGGKFEIKEINNFLNNPDTEAINLILEGELEDTLYSAYHGTKEYVDGGSVHAIINDKYKTYKQIKELKLNQVTFPKTIAIRSHNELVVAIGHINSDKVVLKPRNDSYSSHNVIIIKKSRLAKLENEERINLYNFLVQEYDKNLFWPPIEIRIHFVGRKPVRVIEIKDKNSWNKKFKIKNIPINKTQKNLMLAAREIVKTLVPIDCKDNLCLDFLKKRKGWIFLEANCGALETFYIGEISEYKYLRPILEEIIRE